MTGIASAAASYALQEAPPLVMVMAFAISPIGGFFVVAAGEQP